MFATITFALFAASLLAARGLRLCHTNDFHARYVPINQFNSKCSANDAEQLKCFGGIARIAQAMHSLACDIKFQVGDMVEGSVYDTVFKETIAIDAYRWVGYDVAVFGNHEFNDGPDPIYKTVIATQDRMTWLASNINFTDAPSGFEVNEYIEKADICWVSALTAATNEISSPGSTVHITNELEAIKRSIASCSQQDRVIAINHQGYKSDIQMCLDVPELDLIIGGHSHTNLDQGLYPTKVERPDGSFCWVAQAFAYGRYVGALDVEFDEDGIISLPGIQYVPLDFRVTADPLVQASLRVYVNLLSEEIRNVIGETTGLVRGDRICREEECSMGNLVCDALLAEGARQNATLCIFNGGNVRGSFEEGTVTIEDVLNVFPFGNVGVVITLPGSNVIASIEHGLTALDNTDNAGRFPQVGGMKVTADFSAAAGERIQEVQIGDVAIEKEELYTVVTNSFIADGGDGYSWPGATAFEFSGRAVREVAQDYLTDNSPYTPTGKEGRMVDTSADDSA